MFAAVARSAKRLVILLPGLLIVYLAYANLFPAFDEWLPWWLAFIFTYLLAAYLFIPALLRFLRIIFPAKHLPYYSTTPDGLASDPINIGVVATKVQMLSAMRKAGWHQADERTTRTVLRLITCIVLGRTYLNAPFSNLYLFGRKQDMGFQLPVGEDPSQRHHVRFWAATPSQDPRHIEHFKFWEVFHPPRPAGKILWVGAASRDTGLGIIRHNAQLTHMIHPDTNAERVLIVTGLRKTRLVRRVRTEKLVEPYSLTNRVFTGYLKADGLMKICEL